jgi:hypothetical protein
MGMMGVLRIPGGIFLEYFENGMADIKVVDLEELIGRQEFLGREINLKITGIPLPAEIATMFPSVVRLSRDASTEIRGRVDRDGSGEIWIRSDGSPGTRSVRGDGKTLGTYLFEYNNTNIGIELSIAGDEIIPPLGDLPVLTF